MISNDAEDFINKLNRHSSHAQPKTRRTRAQFACINCRRKKIRCDVQLEGTCTNCTLDHIICQTSFSGPLIERPGSRATSDLSLCTRVAGSDDQTRNVGKKEESPLPSVSIPLSHGVEAGVDCFDDQFESLKPHGLRKYLVRCFLQFIYPTFPVITFFQMASIAAMNEGDIPSCGQFVLNAFLAASIRFSDRQMLRTYGIHSKEQAFGFFYSNAKALFPQQMNEKTYTAIQGLLLMGYCETKSSQDTFFWLGMAHAAAVSLQLDIEPASILQPEKGLRKRLWWCLFSQLTLLEFTTGSTPYIQMQHATVCGLNDEDFERTIPSLLLDDVRKLVKFRRGGPLSIGRQFLDFLDFLQTQQGFSNTKFSKPSIIGWEIKAPPRGTYGTWNHTKSGKDSFAAENLEAATQDCTYLPPEDDPENAGLVHGMERELFTSTFASRGDISKKERLDLYRHQDYFGDDGTANEMQ